MPKLIVTVTPEAEGLISKLPRGYEWELASEDYAEDGTGEITIRYEGDEPTAAIEQALNTNPDVIRYIVRSTKRWTAIWEVWGCLTRETPVQVAVVKSNGDYEVIPQAHLTDASYEGSRDVVAKYNDWSELLQDGDPESFTADEIADMWYDSLDY